MYLSFLCKQKNTNNTKSTLQTKVHIINSHLFLINATLQDKIWHPLKTGL